MKRYFANLLGTWVDITDAATVGKNQPAAVWFEEHLKSPMDFDYINVQYEGKNYRIHTSMIQVVTTD